MPCSFSILLINLIFLSLPPLSLINFLTIATSSAPLTKESAINSASFSMANLISFLSTSVKNGISTFIFGKLILLLLDKTPPSTTLVTISNLLT